MQRLLLYTSALLLMGCAATKKAPVHNLGIELGRAYTNFLFAEQTDTLYARLSPKFQTAIKGKEGFTTLVKQLREDLGEEMRVHGEAAYEEAGYLS